MQTEIAVIGSGAGGAVTACLLAEAGRDVLLIEEGAHLRLDSCQPFSQEELAQKYRNGGITTALGSPKIQYVEGCCVGGGSEINSGLYHRTPPEILERWQQDFGVEALTAADLLPHFQDCEAALRVSPLPDAAPAASLKLHEGATLLGWQSQAVPRWYDYTAGSPGVKQSMTETYIPRALQAGCRLRDRTRIHRLYQENGLWHLQGWGAHGEAISISAAHVFVCGGAIQTPTLLRRSGIGNNVGNSLQMHPTVKLVAHFREAVNSVDMGVPVHQVKQFSPRFSFGCSISTPPYLKLALMDYPEICAQVRHTWQHLAIYYAAIRPESTGTIRPLPGFRDPLVRYRLSDRDLQTLAEALQKLALLLLEAGAIALYPSIAGFTPIASQADLQAIPQQLSRSLTQLMTVHVFASCPMGENRQRCTTDSFGRVHGVDHLYLNDASLLCTAPGVNPQGTIVAIARRNILKFLEKL